MYLGARPETRIMYINSLNYGNIIYSTENVTGFPVENISKDSRTALYIPKNIFRVVSSNNTFQILHSGAPYTITLSNNDYSADDLCIEIKNKMNAAVGSNTYDLSYSTTTGLFSIINSTWGYTLIVTQNIPFWDMIGFIFPSDISPVTGFWVLGSFIRRNTGVELKYDLGGSADCSFFALLGERNKTFSLTSSAIINLRLSNIDDYASADININVTPTIEGCYTFTDSLTNNPFYRYVWLTIIDRENPNENVILSQLFIGGYVSFFNRTINNGFSLQYSDRSLRTESVSGALFFEKYPKYPYLTALTIAYLTKSQLDILQQAWFDIGKSQHFYLSLDSGHVNNDVSQLTWCGVFDSDPNITNVAPRYYNASFTFRGD